MSITSRPCSRPRQRHHRHRPLHGAPVRVLKNKMAREYLRMEKKDVPPGGDGAAHPGLPAKAVFDGDVDGGSFMAGQVPVWCTRSVPCADL